MNAVLTDMTPGFADPVHGAQRTYRALLDVMSRPGLVVDLPRPAIDGVVAPAGMGPAATATLLALLDADTRVALIGDAATPSADAYLRFHTGARTTQSIEEADFTLVRGSALDASVWTRLAVGTDEAPQDGATLVVEIDAFEARDGAGWDLRLSGPGIASETRLSVLGPPRAFWAWRLAQQSCMPRGVDVILVCGERVAAIPRSTRVTIEGRR